MVTVNYYNITPDDWKGTKLNFVGSDEAYKRLSDKIIKIIENDPDEFIGEYTFDSSTSPMLHTATTIFLIDTELQPEQLQIARDNKVQLVHMTYEEATGYYYEQTELESTDYKMLKVLERYLVIDEGDTEALSLIKRRETLRTSLRSRKLE